nr:hypothetical protein [Deltaproteobacteria bacterium]
LDGMWSGTTAVCAHGGRLYAIDNGTLYDIDPESGAFTELTSSWNTRHLVASGAHLFAFEESGSLYRVTV